MCWRFWGFVEACLYFYYISYRCMFSCAILLIPVQILARQYTNMYRWWTTRIAVEHWVMQGLLLIDRKGCCLWKRVCCWIGTLSLVIGNLLKIDAANPAMVGTILVKITWNVTTFGQVFGTSNLPSGLYREDWWRDSGRLPVNFSLSVVLLKPTDMKRTTKHPLHTVIFFN